MLTLTTENRVQGRKIELSECSNKKKEEFDDTVDKIIQEEYQRAKTLLLDNKEKHELLVEALLKYERLSRDEFLILFETGSLESIEQLKKKNFKLPPALLNDQRLLSMQFKTKSHLREQTVTHVIPRRSDFKILTFCITYALINIWW